MNEQQLFRWIFVAIFVSTMSISVVCNVHLDLCGVKFRGGELVHVSNGGVEHFYRRALCDSPGRKAARLEVWRGVSRVSAAHRWTGAAAALKAEFAKL